MGNRSEIGIASWIAEDLQKEFVLAARLGPVDIQVQPRGLLLHRLEEGHVERGGVAREILGVGGGKCLRIFVEQLQGIRLVEARQQRGLEVIQPRAHGRGDAPLQRVRVDVRRFARRGARDDVNAREVRLGDLHLRFHADRGETPRR